MIEVPDTSNPFNLVENPAVRLTLFVMSRNELPMTPCELKTLMVREDEGMTYEQRRDATILLNHLGLVSMVSGKGSSHGKTYLKLEPFGLAALHDIQGILAIQYCISLNGEHTLTDTLEYYKARLSQTLTEARKARDEVLKSRGTGRGDL